MLKLLELEKTMVEGAGAVPLAAAMTPSCNLRGKKVVLVLAGGNIDVTLLSRIIDRGLAAEGRLHMPSDTLLVSLVLLVLGLAVVVASANARTVRSA